MEFVGPEIPESGQNDFWIFGIAKFSNLVKIANLRFWIRSPEKNNSLVFGINCFFAFKMSITNRKKAINGLIK